MKTLFEKKKLKNKWRGKRWGCENESMKRLFFFWGKWRLFSLFSVLNLQQHPQFNTARQGCCDHSGATTLCPIFRQHPSAYVSIRCCDHSGATTLCRSLLILWGNESMSIHSGVTIDALLRTHTWPLWDDDSMSIFVVTRERGNRINHFYWNSQYNN